MTATPMQLQGCHHVTMITADAQRTVDFYAGLLGLRLVKKTVNFDRPDAYHLYLGDEHGTPGSVLTWFEFPGVPPGSPGAGDVHRIVLGVRDAGALAFWEQRLAAAGVATRTEDAGGGATLHLADPEGLDLELAVAGGDDPLRAEADGIPPEHALCGLEGARAYGDFHLVPDTVLTEVLGFEWAGNGRSVLQGGARRFTWSLDAPPSGRPRSQGAGSVHHIAWASLDADHLAWQARVREAGGHVTDVRDRDYFKAIYFREPRGVLFEIATSAPGFTVDEPLAALGSTLRLPAQHEGLRAELERTLRPVVNPRSG